ncbi:MAG: hypothetical protein Fur0041_01520 [Bacteroidia bacterium]
MKNILISAAVLCGLHLTAQVTSETRTVSDFTGVKAGGNIVVEFTQGDKNTVVVETESAGQKDVLTEVKDGVLLIENTTTKNNGGDVTVKITIAKLRSLELSSAATVKSTNTVTTDSLSLLCSGASSIKMMVDAASVKTNLSGAATVRLSGKTKELDVLASGASQLKAYDLISENTRVVASGASSVKVNASVKADLTATGASDVRYSGNPAEKKVNATSGSSISEKANDSGGDTTNIRIGGKDVQIVDGGEESGKRERRAKDSDFEYWDGLDLGINGLLTASNSIEMPAAHEFMELNYAKSYVFAWNMFQKNIHIYKNWVNLGTGFGLSWYHYNFRNSYTLTPNVPFQTASLDSFSYRKNRLNVCYVNVPLFLEFNTNASADRSFHFGAGMQFGYNVFDNKVKQKYELNGETFKRKIKDDYNVNPFKYDIIARIGYGNYTIFGSYSLSTLFEKSKGPTLYPFTAGLHIGF